MGNLSPFLIITLLSKFCEAFTTAFFEHPNIQKLLNSDAHFDAVILEPFWNDAMQVLAHHFNAHLILFSTIASNRWVNNLIANPEPPSYVSDIFLGYSGKMNFFQRTYNFLFGLISDLYLYCYVYPRQNAYIQKYLPGSPHLNELQNNVSLVLTNSHESISLPVPHVPSLIDVGGIHVDPPKELPKELKQLMDGAKNGVIYFSMGSNIQPSDMPEEMKQAILKVLGSRKEKVLWKWDEDNLENKPDNVMISKWFPQQSILAHPNCKLFISHGGLQSTIETIYFGVPVLAIPVAADQNLNAQTAVSFGYGKRLRISEITEKSLGEALNELLENPRYRDNAKYRSKIMHDRPMKPMDLAIYWIEYVVRHKGAGHLRVAGIDLPLYKYYMLDVLGAILGVLGLLVYLLSRLCRCRKTKKSKIE